MRDVDTLPNTHQRDAAADTIKELSERLASRINRILSYLKRLVLQPKWRERDLFSGREVIFFPKPFFSWCPTEPFRLLTPNKTLYFKGTLRKLRQPCKETDLFYTNSCYNQKNLTPETFFIAYEFAFQISS